MKRSLVFAAALVSGTLVLAGCQKKGTNVASTQPTPIPTPAGPQPPKIDFAKVRPYELGVIPVIMYHEIKGDKDDEKNGLTRSVKSFKGDLEELYKSGFYPVNMGDVVEDNIDVPAGKSPVVLTFDDARPSQFQLKEAANSYGVDPECAVGILEEFHKQHPQDWPLKATFFVLPKSKATMEPFGQIGLGDQKLQYLVKTGFEIGNHSTLHHSFRPYTPAQIQQEIGNAHKEIMAAVPDAKVRVVALPMGIYPRDKKNWTYLVKGTYQGSNYEYEAAMAAAWRPIPSPASKAYNPMHLERINCIDGTNGVRDWIKKLTTGGGGAGVSMVRYVSDGDPNVVSYPKSAESLANVDRIKGAGKLAYAYETKDGGLKPIVGISGSDQDKDTDDEDDGAADMSPPGTTTVRKTADGGKAVIEPSKGG